MVQFIGKLTDPDGQPYPGAYILASLNEKSLDQIMYRICEVDDHAEVDEDLIGAEYLCPYVEMFSPTSKALQRQIDRLIGPGQYAFVYEPHIKVPAKNKIALSEAVLAVVPGAAGFAMTTRDSNEVVIVDKLPGGLWETAVDALQRNDDIENIENKKEPEPKRTRSYFA